MATAATSIEFGLGSTSNDTSSVLDFFGSSGRFSQPKATVIHGASAIGRACSNPVDFRRVLLGDVDLCREIQGQNVRRRIPGKCGVATTVTITVGAVACKKGNGHVTVWQGEIVKYSRIRVKLSHPNIVQLYGLVSSDQLYATIFHEDLIPVEKRNFWACTAIRIFPSSISIAILCGNYVHSTTHSQLLENIWSVAGKWLHRGDSTFWIRRSTDQVCVTISSEGPDIQIFFPVLRTLVNVLGPISLLGKNWDSVIIDSISLVDFHERCVWYLSRTHMLSLPMQSLVRPGGTVALGNASPDAVLSDEIAFIPNRQLEDSG
ncbi:hypothetical protein DFH07DRAFT_985448 [Mycena maculata]|uniref:Uncharacterized protein n=1 Tax=Mycena maculata TaxID=230809 RepID=A0AAD7MYJ3_9AGAR|nr:hypothetical protein DFH07DRAFT_985448 [Mycena maculata]